MSFIPPGAYVTDPGVPTVVQNAVVLGVRVILNF